MRLCGHIFYDRITADQEISLADQGGVKPQLRQYMGMAVVGIEDYQDLPARTQDFRHFGDGRLLRGRSLDEDETLRQGSMTRQSVPEVRGDVNVHSDHLFTAQDLEQGGIEKEAPAPGHTYLQDIPGTTPVDDFLHGEHILGKIEDRFAKPGRLVNPVVAVGIDENLPGPVCQAGIAAHRRGGLPAHGLEFFPAVHLLFRHGLPPARRSNAIVAAMLFSSDPVACQPRTWTRRLETSYES